ncbi:SMAKA protein, partial [Atractosteus spatula]|nr:SMAKA protein [Atractosteus spatula]
MDFKNKALKMHSFFINRGYPTHVIDSAFTWAKNSPRIINSTRNSRSHNRIHLVLPYHPNTLSIPRTIINNYSILQDDPSPSATNTLNQCHIIYIMGCIKSKQNNLTQNASSVEKADGKPKKYLDENAALVNSETRQGEEGSLRVNPGLLDYAQRLSEEIVAKAVQQWAEVDSRYSDIPYIESDVP